MFGWALFRTINVDQRGGKTESERYRRLLAMTIWTGYVGSTLINVYGFEQGLRRTQGSNKPEKTWPWVRFPVGARKKAIYFLAAYQCFRGHIKPSVQSVKSLGSSCFLWMIYRLIINITFIFIFTTVATDRQRFQLFWHVQILSHSLHDQSHWIAILDECVKVHNLDRLLNSGNSTGIPCWIIFTIVLDKIWLIQYCFSHKEWITM